MNKLIKNIINKVLTGVANQMGCAPYEIKKDGDFINKIWDIIRNEIGERRFEQLRKLSETYNVFYEGQTEGLKFIAFLLNYVDEDEKKRIEILVKNKFNQALHSVGFPYPVLTSWERSELQGFEWLMVRYAENEEEFAILNRRIAFENRKIARQYQPLKDEELEKLIDLHTQERNK